MIDWGCGSLSALGSYGAYIIFKNGITTPIAQVPDFFEDAYGAQTLFCNQIPDLVPEGIEL
jgi:hypothetical protein